MSHPILNQRRLPRKTKKVLFEFFERLVSGSATFGEFVEHKDGGGHFPISVVNMPGRKPNRRRFHRVAQLLIKDILNGIPSNNPNTNS